MAWADRRRPAAGLRLARCLGAAARRGRPPAPKARHRAAAVAIAAVALIFGVHSLVDWTWFVPGTAVVALVCAGWVAGRGPLAPRARPRARRAVDRGCARPAPWPWSALALLWAIWQPLRSDQADDAPWTSWPGRRARPRSPPR